MAMQPPAAPETACTAESLSPTMVYTLKGWLCTRKSCAMSVRVLSEVGRVPVRDGEKRTGFGEPAGVKQTRRVEV